jgi:uncharacterized membrane protein YkvA (DUF1232 family)
VDDGKLRRDMARVEAGFWPKFRRVARRLPFAGELLAAYYCARDPATPKYAKAALFGALAYFVLPVDMVPDFIAGLGFTDDATILMAAVRAFRQHITPSHRERARSALDATRNGPPPEPPAA